MSDPTLIDRAVSNLPSRDLDATHVFYAGFGFERAFRDDGWMILRRDTGFPRLHEVRLQDWGLRAGHLVDPDGNLLTLIAEPVR
jgi:hypothetical protein